ncbi:MAG: hypothetical protein ABIH23_08215 [bacterium]
MDQSQAEVLGKREIVAALCASVVLVVLLSWFAGKTDKFNGDEYCYLNQAQNPVSVFLPPHGLRILTTRIVSLLPIDIRNGFYVVTIIGVTGAVALAYIILRRMGCTIWVSLACLSGFVFHHGLSQVVYHFPLVDPLSFLLIELSILAILARNDRLFSCSLLLGVLNRETALFLIPVYHLARWRRWRTWRATAATGLVCSAAILAFLLTRFVLHSLSDEAHFQRIIEQCYPLMSAPYERFDLFYFNEFREIVSNPERLRNLLSLNTLGAGFGVLAPLSLLGFLWGRRESRALMAYLILIWIQLLFAHQVERLVFFAFPVFVILSGEALRRTEELTPPFRHGFVGLTALFGALWAGWFPGGILLAFLLPGLLWIQGRSLRRTPEQIRSASDSLDSANCFDYLRTGFSPVNLILISLVLVNLLLICVSRPALIGQLQDLFPSLRYETEITFKEPVFVGKAEIRESNTGENVLLFVPIGEADQTPCILLPAQLSFFRNCRKIIAIILAYPLEEGSIKVGITTPRGEAGAMELFDPNAQLTHFRQYQLNNLYKSPPLYFEFESRPNEFMYILPTKGIVLVDILFFDSSMYTKFTRHLRLTGSDISGG